jgi:hypothetical protein
VTQDSEALFYKAAGPAAAIVIGAALTPLRELTPASNFTFVFIALTIVVSELGGRGAGLLTALVSALSLDFFLTQPYLRLEMENKHDVVAFLGLAVCGLIASSLAAYRRDRIAGLESALAHRRLLDGVLERWDPAQPVGPQLDETLRRCLPVLPLAAVVVRDEAGRVLAASEGAEPRPPPAGVLQGDSLLVGAEPGRWAPNLALPAEGSRIPLGAGTRPLGWLEVWGDGRPASLESRRALADLARLVALLLSSVERASPARG